MFTFTDEPNSLQHSLNMRRKKGILLLLIFLFSLIIPGCTLYRPLTLSQLQGFKNSVLRAYPLSQISCKYEYGAGVVITVSRSGFSEKSAYYSLSPGMRILSRHCLNYLKNNRTKTPTGKMVNVLKFVSIWMCGAVPVTNLLRELPKKGITQDTTQIPTPGMVTPPGMARNMWITCPGKSPLKKLKRP